MWYEFTAKFDSGATDNWMSMNVATLLECDIETEPATEYQTFTGGTLASSEVVRQIVWHGDGTSAKSRRTDFRLIDDNAPFDVLFGSRLLFSEEIYSFNDANLILTDKKKTKGL